MIRSSVMRAAAGVVVLGSTIMSPVSIVVAQSEQSECTCVVQAVDGSVGSISRANPDVFVTGVSGRQEATAGTPLISGSVVNTGPSGSADINLGPSCQFRMSGSMSMQIVPQQGGLCVQVLDNSVGVATAGAAGGAGGAGAALAGAAGLAAGAGVLVSLGMLQSVSK